MAKKTILEQLPDNTRMVTYGNPVKIDVSLTLETVAQALALREAIDRVILPMMKIRDER